MLLLKPSHAPQSGIDSKVVTRHSDLLDVDQLADVHVVVTAAHVRPHSLDHLPDHGHDDVTPREGQRLAVEQLLQQRHHVAMVGRAVEGRDCYRGLLLRNYL